MTGEEWDAHWWRIWNDAVRDGHANDDAEEIADRETAEQFRPRPGEAA